jgi:hypothetical protein
MEKEQKVYIIKYLGKRYNSKSFPDYEAGRKYLRRLITKKFGSYRDDYTMLGFAVTPK